MAQAAISMRPTRRLSESSDEEELDSGEVDDWGGGERDAEGVEGVAVTIGDGHMPTLCAQSPTEALRESKMPRRSPSPDGGGDAERCKDRSSPESRSSSPNEPIPTSRLSEDKSRSRSRSPSQPGLRSRSRSRSKQPQRSVSRSSSSSGSGSSSESSSSSSSEDSRMRSTASESSVR